VEDGYVRRSEGSEAVQIRRQDHLVISRSDDDCTIMRKLTGKQPRLAERGQPAGGPAIRGVVIFNGGLFTDGHSHPWYTTPILRRLPTRARRGVGRSFRLFKLTGGVMWSKAYEVTDAEVRELYNAMHRRDGLFYLAAAAGFVADYKAQGDRLEFGRLFKAYRDQFPFLVGGSDEDSFEHRQIDFAEERLAHLGLQIERLPGGHLTTK
jgi:hypothetical protein